MKTTLIIGICVLAILVMCMCRGDAGDAAPVYDYYYAKTYPEVPIMTVQDQRGFVEHPLSNLNDVISMPIRPLVNAKGCDLNASRWAGMPDHAPPLDGRVHYDSHNFDMWPVSVAGYGDGISSHRMHSLTEGFADDTLYDNKFSYNKKYKHSDKESPNIDYNSVDKQRKADGVLIDAELNDESLVDVID